MYLPVQLEVLDLATIPSTLADTVVALVSMLQRAFLCLTAFLATSSTWIGGGNAVATAETQYLLGLGERARF